MVDFALAHVSLCVLILLRVVGFIGASPILSLRAWPAPAKAGLAGLIALSVAPSVHANAPSPLADPGGFVLIALKETIVGLALGLVATVVFSAASIAGQAIDLQAGFSSGALFEPGFGAAAGLSGSLLQMLFTLYFLGMNGLDGWMLAILHSYEWVPLGHLGVPKTGPGLWMTVLNAVMAIAVEMCAPVLAALLLTDVTLALVSRMVPQMNVFVVGLPLKLFVGLVLFGAAMPGCVYVFGRLFNVAFQATDAWLRWLGG